MEILNAIGLLFATLMVMISLSKATDNLTWKVVQKVRKYGEDLSLSCHVENCCQESAGWGKWTPKNEFITIFIDVKDLNVDNSSKYDGAIDKTGFSLDIRNLTRDDLNLTYSCTYGFLVSKKKMLTKTDAFLENYPVGSTVNSKPGTTQLVIPLLLSPVAVICIVVAIIVVYRKKKSRKPKVGSVKLDEIGLCSPGNNFECKIILSDRGSPVPISIDSNSTQAQHPLLHRLVPPRVHFPAKNDELARNKISASAPSRREESPGDRLSFHQRRSLRSNASFHSCKSRFSDE